MTIKVKLPDENNKTVPIAIVARKVGRFFAVHRDIRWRRKTNGDCDYSRHVFNESGYTVTHVPTGYAIVRSVRARRKAFECARMMESIKAVPWQMKRPKDFARFAKRIPEDVKKAVVSAVKAAA
jgi:hypothetical protein